MLLKPSNISKTRDPADWGISVYKSVSCTSQHLGSETPRLNWLVQEAKSELYASSWTHSSFSAWVATSSSSLASLRAAFLAATFLDGARLILGEEEGVVADVDYEQLDSYTNQQNSCLNLQ